MENTQHLPQFVHLLVSFLDVASEEKGDGMDGFGADLLIVGLPP